MGKYLEAARQAGEDINRERARLAGIAAPPVSPDDMGRAFQVADRRGLPPSVAADNLADYTEQDALDNLQGAAGQSPVLARWLGNPDHAAVAKDDTTILGSIGKLFREGIQSKTTIMPGMQLPVSVLGMAGDYSRRERAKDAGPQMQAQNPGWFSELVGQWQTGWFTGQQGAALRGLPDLSSARTRAIEQQVAQGLGYSSREAMEVTRTGALVADLGRQAAQSNVLSQATQAGFEEIAAAEETGSTGNIVKAAATNPRAIMSVVVNSMGATAPNLAMSASMPASRAVAAVTAGAGSFSAEQGFTVLDVMQDSGVDLTDAAQVTAFLRDEPAMARARQKATQRGLAVAAFDALTAGFAGRLLSNARRSTASIVGRVAAEGGLQAAGGAAGETAAQLVSEGRITSQSDIVLEAAAEVPTFLAEGRGQLAQARRNAIANADRFDASQEQRSIAQLVDLAGQSKTKARAASRFEALVQDMTREGEDTVYLSAEGARTLFQSAAEGSPLFELANQADLREAMATGGEVAIPLAKYVTTVTPELHAQVAEQVRLTPGGRHDLPAVAPEEIQQAIAEGLAEAQQQDARENGPAGQVFDEVYGQLLSRQGEKLARQNATVVQSVYRNLAERAGTDAWSLFQQFRINIPGARTDTRGRRKGIDVDVDPYLDALRSGQLPTDADIYGERLSAAVVRAGGIQEGPEGVASSAGMSLDDALMWAYEEGFLEQAPGAGAQDVQSLLDLLARDLAGEGVYRASAMNPERARFRERAQALQTDLDAAGVDLQQADNATARAALGMEPGQRFYQDALPDPELVTQLRARIAELEAELRTDKLTGMRNRRAFDEDAGLGWPAVAVIDLDGLKKVNDIVGHEAGDAMLKAAADVMLAAEGDGVRFYRQGGDEYTARFAEGVDPDAVMREIRDRLNSVDILFTTPEGAIYNYAGIGAGYGIGQDFATADAAQNADKQRREASGEREARNSDGAPRRLRRLARRAEGAAAPGEGGDSQPLDAEAPEDGLTRLYQSPQLTEQQMERMDTDELDRIAYGVTDGDIVELSPDEIKIQYPGDLENPQARFDAGGMKWADSVDLSEPVDIDVLENGTFALSDGHHRWFAAQKRGEKLQANVTVKGNPIRTILARQADSRRLSQSERGSVTFRSTPEGRQFDIELLAGMDASTFMHEMGHVYLELLNDLGAREDAPQQIRDDLATLNEWLGRDASQPLTTEQHEKFARGMEQYLREGKAPSSALRRVFAAFKVWLTQIYRSALALDVELTDDVRGVMDRIIASDAEIAEARAEQYQEALITDAVAVGMSAEDFEAYNRAVRTARADAEAVVAAELMTALQQEQKAWYRQEKQQVRAQVLQELRETPVYRAQRLLRTGKLPDGTEAPEALRVKLSKEDLLDRYGQSFLRNLRGTYSVEGGMDADSAASLLGFGTGRELVEALVNAPPLSEAVAAETDARMASRHPDPLTDGTLPDRALVAAHRDRQAEVMLREVRALESHVSGQARSQGAVIKGIAQAIIAGKTLRTLQPATYRAAEAKAGREAFQAASAGDWPVALAARRRQLLNFELFREAVRTRTEMVSAANALAKYQTTKVRQRLGKAGHDYLDQIDALLDRFDFRKISDAAADRRASLNAWIQSQAEKGIDLNLPARILDEAKRVPYRSMTVEDMRALRDAVRAIDHLARLKGKLLLNNELRDAAEVDEAMARSLREHHDARPDTTGVQSRKESIRKAFMQGRVLQATANDIVRELDGYVDQGAIWRNTVGVIRDAVYNRVNPALKKAQEDLATLYVKHYTRDEIANFRERFNAPEANNDQWTKQRLLALALNWGNQGNRDAILSQARARLTPEQVAALLGRLDARDWAFVQDVWALVDSQWPAIAEAQRRRTGLAPEKVEPSGFTITTSDGKTLSIPGGYYPLKYEPDSIKTMKDEVDDFYNAIRTGRTAKAATRNGHTLERVGSGGRTVLLDTGVISQHLRDVIRDLHLGDAVNYVHNALNGPDFRSAVDETGMQEYARNLEVWLKDVAAGEIGPRVWHERAMRAARQNFTASVLTWKASTALLQVTGVIPTSVTLGYSRTMGGLGQYLAKPLAMTRYAREASPYLASRLDTHIEAVQTVMNAEAGRFASGKSAVIRFGYWAIGRVQSMVDTVTWLAAEQAGMDQFNDLARARAYADDVVSRAQGSGEFIDKAMMQRGTLGDNVRQSEWIKATTALQGYMIAKGNLLYEQTRKTNFKSPRQAAKWAMDMVMLLSVEGLISAAIAGKLPGDDDDDGAGEEWAKFIAGDAAANFFGVFPGGGTMVSSFRGYDAGGVLANAWRAAADLQEQVAQGEMDRGVVKAAVKLAGVTFGLPSAQINKTIDAIQARADGKGVSPMEYITGPKRED